MKRSYSYINPTDFLKEKKRNIYMENMYHEKLLSNVTSLSINKNFINILNQIDLNNYNFCKLELISKLNHIIEVLNYDLITPYINIPDNNIIDIINVLINYNNTIYQKNTFCVYIEHESNIHIRVKSIIQKYNNILSINKNIELKKLNFIIIKNKKKKLFIQIINLLMMI